MFAVLQPPVLSREFVQAQHRIVAWMIGVVAGRAILDLAAIRDGQAVGDGNRFAVGDQKSVIGSLERRPAAYARCRPGAQQINRRPASEIVAPAICREMPFMRPPAEFRWLRALTDEAVDRPGVDEFARVLRRHRDLRIALGDMDDLYA